MTLICVLIYVIFSVFSVLNIKNKLSKIYLLYIIGTTSIYFFVSIFNPLGLYPVSDKAWLLLTMGNLMFVLGFGARIKWKIYNINFNNTLTDNIVSLFDNKYFNIVFFVCLSVLLYLASTQWAIIVIQAGMGNLKVDFFDLVFEGNHVLYFFYQTIMFPLFHFSCLALSYQLISQKIRWTSFFLLIYVLVFCFVGGKRGYFSILFIYFILSLCVYKFSIHNRGLKKAFPIKTLAVFVFIAFAGATFMTTLGRGGGTEAGKEEASDAANSVLENMLVYQIGPYRAFDIAIQKNYVKRNGGFLLGRATLGGALDYYGCYVLNVVGIPVKPVRAITMVPLQEEEIYIGKDRDWNFAYTAFVYFLFDFGFIGVILIPYLFGIFVRYFFDLFEKTGTIGSMAIIGYLFVGSGLGGTWFNIQLYTQPIFLIFYFLHRTEINGRKYELFKKTQDTIQYS